MRWGDEPLIRRGYRTARPRRVARPVAPEPEPEPAPPPALPPLIVFHYHGREPFHGKDREYERGTTAGPIRVSMAQQDSLARIKWHAFPPGQRCLSQRLGGCGDCEWEEIEPIARLEANGDAGRCSICGWRSSARLVIDRRDAMNRHVLKSRHQRTQPRRRRRR